jgi:hypothetical protein
MPNLLSGHLGAGADNSRGDYSTASMTGRKCQPAVFSPQILYPSRTVVLDITAPDVHVRIDMV